MTEMGEARIIKDDETWTGYRVEVDGVDGSYSEPTHTSW